MYRLPAPIRVSTPLLGALLAAAPLTAAPEVAPTGAGELAELFESVVDFEWQCTEACSEAVAAKKAAKYEESAAYGKAADTQAASYG